MRYCHAAIWCSSLSACSTPSAIMVAEKGVNLKKLMVFFELIVVELLNFQ